MSDIAKRDFVVLVVDGINYLTWATDVEIRLDSICLDHTIVQPQAGKDERTKPGKAKALHFLQHHLHLVYDWEGSTGFICLSIWLRGIHWFYGSPWRTSSTSSSRLCTPEHKKTRSPYASMTISLWQHTTPLYTRLCLNCVYVTRRSLMLIWREDSIYLPSKKHTAI